MPLPDTASCRNCDTEITVDSRNCFDIEGHDMYMCYNCREFIGLAYRDELHSPDELLEKRWIHTDNQAPDRCSNTCDVYRVSTKKEEIAVNLLNTEAKDEKSSFMSYNSDSVDAIIATRDNRAVGYLIWGTNRGDPEIRQVFVERSSRREGIGTSLFEAFIDIIDNSYFCVNSPESATLLILDNLGYVDHSNDEPTLNGCSWSGNYIDPPDDWLQSD